MRTVLDASKKLLQQEEEVVKSRMMVERLKLRQEVPLSFLTGFIRTCSFFYPLQLLQIKK